MATPVFSAVGSYLGGNGTGLTSFTLTTATIGNCMVASVGVGSNTVKTDSITSANVIWKRIVPPVNDATIVLNVDLWLGTVIATGTSVTQAVTYTGSVAGLPIYFHLQEFSSGLGASAIWSVDGTVLSGTDHATSTTLTFDPLTPSAGPRLFYGICWPQQTNAVVGSTAGITYALSTDGLGRIEAYDLAAVGARAPTATIGTTSRYVSLSVVLRAGLLRRPLYYLNSQLVEISDGDAFPGGIIGGNPTDIQAFTIGGTWNKPAGCTLVKAIGIGGGGGGGTGRRGATLTQRGGGGAGGGGGYSIGTFAASVLASTENVVVGAGGTGAASLTTDDTDGSAGQDGGDSSFRSANGVTGGGGGGGGAGTATTGGASGLAGGGHSPGTVGGLGSATSSGGSGSVGNTLGATGGGGGSGISSGNSAGGTGPSSGANNGSGLAGSGTIITSGNAPPGNSGPANQPYTGTGGGGSRANAASATGSGGAGGSYGGGGGGSSAMLNGFSNGPGGNGAPGFVIVYSY